MGRYIYMPRLSLNISPLVTWDKLPEPPATFWLHFFYRYILGVSNSDLSHCLVDVKKTKYAGIDFQPAILSSPPPPPSPVVTRLSSKYDLFSLIFVPLPKRDHLNQLLTYFDKCRVDIITNFVGLEEVTHGIKQRNTSSSECFIDGNEVAARYTQLYRMITR